MSHDTRLRWLAPNVKLEPLFFGWYAWSHLISPATAAMNVANSHVKILKSYLAAPQVHAAAVKNPAMLGGPFIDYEGGRVEEIREHLARTEDRLRPQLELAEAIRALDELLATEAKGFSLEPLYARVPEPLRGYVELVYDLAGAPGMRLFERALYRSRYYDASLQSIGLSRTTSDHRAFALSTPRLPDPERVDVTVPFASPALDRLCRARRAPADPAGIAEALGVAPAQAERFTALFTSEPPPPRPRWTGPGVRVRYFGHACVLVESPEATVLVDPTASYLYPSNVPRFTYGDLPDVIDYVLVTHNHQDHFLLETLLQIRHQVGEVIVPRSGSGGLADPSLRHVLGALGFSRVREIEALERVEIPGGSVTGVPFLGEHADLDIASKAAFVLDLGGFKAMFAADSNNLEPRVYDIVRKEVGPVDVLFVGLECDGAPLSWLYGPLLTRPIARKMDQSRRLNGSDFEKANDIVTQLGPREVYVYALGQEPWLGYVMSVRYTPESKPIVASDQLVRACRERGVHADRLFGSMEKTYGA